MIALVGGAAALLLHNDSMASDAPKDANSLLANALAPSMTSIVDLSKFFDYFAAAAKNATNARTQVRLGLYALVMQLKKAMLERGASPDETELAAISQSSTTGIGGIQQSGAPADAQQAAYAALVDSQQDPGMVNQYAAALRAASSNTQLTPSQQARLRQYVLACKAKYVALKNGVALSSAIYFAIANANPVGSVSANSIVAYT